MFREIIPLPESGDTKIKWQLAAVVTRQSGNKPGYTGELGNTFKSLDAQVLKSSDYEMRFF